MLLIGTKSLLFCDVFQYDFLEFNKIQNKGAPGSESRTGPRLVSPAAGGEKKKEPTVLWTQNVHFTQFNG